LLITGSVNGIHQIEHVLQDASYIAQVAVAALRGEDASQIAAPNFKESSMNFPWPIFEHPKGKEFVDFDEDLQIRDIVNATKSGYRDVQLVKRFSTVGMGPSQGRHSALPTAVWWQNLPSAVSAKRCDHCPSSVYCRETGSYCRARLRSISPNPNACSPPCCGRKNDACGQLATSCILWQS